MYASLRTVLGLGLGLAVGSSAVLAENINIDFGDLAPPSAAYGAAAGQPGTWNAISAFAGSGPHALADVSGNPITATLSWSVFATVNDGVFNHAGTTGDDAALLDDFVTWPPLGAVSFMISGLSPGPYEVYSYVFAPNGADTLVTVQGANQGSQLVGGNWPGSHQAGVSYALHTLTLQPGDTLTVTVNPWNGAWGGINGLQIVQVPEPASAALLGLLVVPACLRRR